MAEETSTEKSGTKVDAGVIGGMISAIASEADKDVGLTALSNYLSNMSEKDKATALRDTTSNQYKQLLEMLTEYQNSQVTPDKEVVSSYYNELSSYDPTKYVIDASATDFNFNSGMDDYKNKYYDDIIQEAADTTQNTAAGAGVGRGTGAAAAIARDVANKKESLDTTAANQYNQAYNQALSTWQSELNAANSRNTSLQNAESSKLANMGTLAEAYNTNTAEGFANLYNLLMNSANSLNTAQGNVDSAGQSDSGLFGVIGNLF
jgi:hypothetical protein